MSKVADFLKDFFNFFYRVRLRSEKIDRLIDNHEESVNAIKDIKQNIEIDDLNNEIILFGGGNSTVTITNNQTTSQVYLVNN